ncbi:hypothetical protein J3458_002660 [Metarhizium acridum]|uniref:uncharacterized protein n=1 Tax=Metarhizium acridum TaxID=92637 RepID=UPI001C6CA27B|nr:hypothetical protein J3458_002660 [Metarhizium acridum]
MSGGRTAGLGFLVCSRPRFDATAYMIEEIPDPQHQGPKIMLYCVAFGMVTGFIFLSGLLFCVDTLTTPWVRPGDLSWRS